MQNEIQRPLTKRRNLWLKLGLLFIIIISALGSIPMLPNNIEDDAEFFYAAGNSGNSLHSVVNMPPENPTDYDFVDDTCTIVESRTIGPDTLQVRLKLCNKGRNPLAGMRIKVMADSITVCNTAIRTVFATAILDSTVRDSLNYRRVDSGVCSNGTEEPLNKLIFTASRLMPPLKQKSLCLQYVVRVYRDGVPGNIPVTKTMHIVAQLRRQSSRIDRISVITLLWDSVRTFFGEEPENLRESRVSSLD